MANNTSMRTSYSRQLWTEHNDEQSSVALTGLMLRLGSIRTLGGGDARNVTWHVEIIDVFSIAKALPFGLQDEVCLVFRVVTVGPNISHYIRHFGCSRFWLDKTKWRMARARNAGNACIEVSSGSGSKTQITAGTRRWIVVAILTVAVEQ
jgi:hypothetical protein